MASSRRRREVGPATHLRMSLDSIAWYDRLSAQRQGGYARALRHEPRHDTRERAASRDADVNSADR